MRKPRPREACDLSKAMESQGSMTWRGMSLFQEVGPFIPHWDGARVQVTLDESPAALGAGDSSLPEQVWRGGRERQGFNSLTAVLSGEEPGRGAQGLAQALLTRRQ